MLGFTVEKRVGKFPLTDTNLLIKDTDDMDAVEFWEDKLLAAKQPFVIGFREIRGRIYYSIYTTLRKKGSIFK